jgi:hypothetical protein
MNILSITATALVLADRIAAEAAKDPASAAKALGASMTGLTMTLAPHLAAMKATIRPCGAEGCLCHIQSASAIAAIEALVPLAHKCREEGERRFTAEIERIFRNIPV